MVESSNKTSLNSKETTATTKQNGKDFKISKTKKIITKLQSIIITDKFGELRKGKRRLIEMRSKFVVYDLHSVMTQL
jgi:hypothetical protein